MAAPMQLRMSNVCLCNLHQIRLINNAWHRRLSTPIVITTRKKSKQVKPSQYCVDFVKKCDYEGYLCTLLYPKDCQMSAFALRALYIELAQVQDVTSDKMRAIMRLQFWKDTIEKMFQGNPPETPVAFAVTNAIHKHKLSKIWFTRILEERADQLDKKFRTIRDVEDAAENTATALTCLILEAAGIKNLNADHCASHLGRCQGLITLLRGCMFHAKRNQIYLPSELLLEHKVSEEQILRCQGDKNVTDAVYDIASQAMTHLETARYMTGSVPKETYPLFLHAVILNHFLMDLQKVDFNVFDERLHKRRHNFAWILMIHNYFRTGF